MAGKPGRSGRRPNPTPPPAPTPGAGYVRKHRQLKAAGIVARPQRGRVYARTAAERRPGALMRKGFWLDCSLNDRLKAVTNNHYDETDFLNEAVAEKLARLEAQSHKGNKS